MAGPLWADHGLVFCSEIGTPHDPSNVRRTFARIAKRAGLDARFPYLLRHSAASLLIDAGAGIEESPTCSATTRARCYATTGTRYAQ